MNTYILFGFHFLLTDIKTALDAQIIFHATHTTLGHKLTRNLVGYYFSQSFAQRTVTFLNVRKKNFNVPSTHYTHSQTSTSAGIIFETIWLILIGSICLHMSQNIWTILTHQSNCQQKQFLMRMCPSTHDKSWHPEKSKFSFAVSTLNIGGEHRKISKEKIRR